MNIKFEPLANWLGIQEFLSSLDKDTWDKWYHFGKESRNVIKAMEREIAITFFTRGIAKEGDYLKVVSIGYLNNVNNESCRLGLVVSPAWRGQGIGTQHTKYLIEEAKKRNLKKIYLSVDLTNKTALMLWKANGFKVIQHFKDNPTRVEMVLELTAQIKEKPSVKKNRIEVEKALGKIKKTIMSETGMKLYLQEGNHISALLQNNLHWISPKVKRPLWLRKIFREYKDKEN